MAAKPEDRPASGETFAAELEAFAKPRSRWPWIIAAAMALLLAGGWFLRPGPAVERPDPFAADATKRLAVRVSFTGGAADIEDRSPATGDHLRFTINAPAGLHLGLFLFTSAGKLRKIAHWPPLQQAGKLAYPSQPKEAAQVTGVPGTEIVLVCGRPDRRIGLAEVRSWWGEEQPWPHLPENSLVRLQRMEVKIEDRPRDIGKIGKVKDPVSEVAHRLEALRLVAPFLDGIRRGAGLSAHPLWPPLGQRRPLNGRD